MITLPVYLPKFKLVVADNDEGEKIHFNESIRPILSSKCFFCHGPDEKHREAGLRLDTREGAIKEHKGVRAIVPGNPEQSELIDRIYAMSEDDVMPPPDSHKTLKDHEKELLKKWIKQGAEYQKHWTYIRPQRHEVPLLKKNTLVNNDIDKFIQFKLQKKGFAPSKLTDRITLIRRIYFDLIGLPPSVDDVEAFVTDKDPKAYEKVVDHLLKSKHYGERMAIKWLDLVRYADSVGYHSDVAISQSPYRDYVIDSFNKNIPYDQFTREQLAGDLIDSSTLENKVASGYNRLNLTTNEGGAQAKEYLSKYATDRVKNVSAVWMGATMGCCECHDHKYDPYTAKDFYSFASFFADLKEVGVYGKGPRLPTVAVFQTEDEKKKFSEFEYDIEVLNQKLKVTTPEVAKSQLLWERNVKLAIEGEKTDRHDVVWVDDTIRTVDKFKNGEKINWERTKENVFDGETSRLTKSKNKKNTLTYSVNFKHSRELVEGDVLFCYVKLNKGKNKEPSSVGMKFNKTYYYWGKNNTTSKEDESFIRMGELPVAGEWKRLEIKVEKVDNIKTIDFYHVGGSVYWDTMGVNTTSLIEFMPNQDIVNIISQSNSEEREKRVQDKVDELYRGISWDYQSVSTEIHNKKKQFNDFKKTLVYSPVSESVQPREVRVLPRGDWQDESGEIVTPAIPSFLGKIKTNKDRLTRMDLANWFVSKKNPMTSRVFVNNLWYIYFGAGLSNVLNDLGSQGEWPSHPELLDWLALEFEGSNWDVKYMVKLIVMSHTYKQSSVSRNELTAIDPYNRLLGRQSALRYPAELVRDNALKISGLLVEDIGGLSAKPYQPKGFYKELNFPKRVYEVDKDKQQYRRGLYTHWQRTFLHPFLASFDAPAREACTAQRSISNTPLQTLALLNDPSFVEAARVFAEKIVLKSFKTNDEAVEWAYKQVLSRAPEADVKNILINLYERHHKQYENSKTDAVALLSIGQRPYNQDCNVSELAAWTSIVRSIFSLHETITRY